MPKFGVVPHHEPLDDAVLPNAMFLPAASHRANQEPNTHMAGRPQALHSFIASLRACSRSFSMQKSPLLQRSEMKPDARQWLWLGVG